MMMSGKKTVDIVVLTIMFLIVTVVGIVLTQLDIFKLTIGSDKSIQGPSNNLVVVQALTLWTPPRVEAQLIPLTFFYETNEPNNIKVNLQFKLKGDQLYKDARLEGPSTIQSSAGKQAYSITWNVAKDIMASEEDFDIKIQLTANDRPVIEDEIRNVHFGTRETVRNQIQNYLIYYGTWTNEQIDLVKEKYELVIVDTQAVTAEQVQRLRSGQDPHDAGDDVLVLGYLSVGEDSRTAGMTPEEMKLDPRFVLDGTGPSIDPRAKGTYPNGGDLPNDISIVGKPTNGGFAPYYLNDNYVTNRVGNPGIPDINKNFLAAFVNPGHPEWLKGLAEMTHASDKVSGIKELLNTDYGAGFGCDGLFLDTLDTAAPNSFTDSSSSNPSEFEWVTKGTQQLLGNIRQMYPDKFLLANRGLFFYNPDLPAYKFTLRGIVDFVLFESFRLDSSSEQWFNELIFNDNKYNYAQKLIAEADRSDGFRLLSLGYAEGPEGELAKMALHGELNPTRQQLLDDVKETSALGMLHYISNASVNDINTFVMDHKESSAQPPVWGSTKTPFWGKPFNEVRKGVQIVDIRGEVVYVHWDVAHSMARPITYSLYIKSGKPFDFNKELESQSRRIELPVGPPPANYYGLVDRTYRYPYRAIVDGLESGKTYYLVLRAKNTLGQYDQNTKSMKFVAP